MAAAPVKRSIVLDATNQSLGRFASEVAKKLRGKHLVSFSPNKLPEVHIHVRNLRSIRLTVKQAKKPVHHFSGYPGGLKTTELGKSFAADPERAFRRVVRRMLPDNRLRTKLLRFLHITE